MTGHIVLSPEWCMLGYPGSPFTHPHKWNRPFFFSDLKVNSPSFHCTEKFYFKKLKIVSHGWGGLQMKTSLFLNKYSFDRIQLLKWLQRSDGILQIKATLIILFKQIWISSIKWRKSIIAQKPGILGISSKVCSWIPDSPERITVISLLRPDLIRSGLTFFGWRDQRWWGAPLAPTQRGAPSPAQRDLHRSIPKSRIPPHPGLWLPCKHVHSRPGTSGNKSL